MSEQTPVVPTPHSSSPTWSSTTKMVVSLTVVALVAALLVYFHNLLGPIILAFILAFLLHPLAVWLSNRLKMSWRASVNLIYLALVILIIGVLAVSGIAIIQQIQSLFEFLNRFITDLPNLVQQLSSSTYTLGPFEFSLAQFDLINLTDQIINTVRPLLGKAGSLITQLATGAASMLGWSFFILLVSYYLLAEGSQIRENLVRIEIPGYNEDMRRLTRELANIWNAFLRGQLIISLLTVVVYTLILTILGLRFSLAIALMAGLARFVPYVGPWITWITTALVAFLLSDNYFGLAPIHYTILILIVCVVVDWIFDNIVVPRMMGKTLGVHPAGVLVAALVAASLLGIVGLVLAAPALATVNLLGRYVSRKMFDLNPWPKPEQPPDLPRFPGQRTFGRLRAIWRWLRKQG